MYMSNTSPLAPGTEITITEKIWDDDTEWSARCRIVSVTPKTAQLLILDCWGDILAAKGKKIRRSLPNIREGMSRIPVHSTQETQSDTY